MISHVLYMDDLKGFSNSYDGLKKMVEVIEMFTSDIGMELGLKKCKVVNVRGGKYVKCGGIALKSGGVIEELNQEEVNTYLGVDELVGTKHDDMKETRPSRPTMRP